MIVNHLLGGWSEGGEGVEGGQGGAKPIWTFPHYKVRAVFQYEVRAVFF